MTVDTEAITARLAELRRKHEVVDDCWYSCPLATQEDGTSECCNSDLMENPRCNCGADAHNAKLDALGGDIAALLAEVARLREAHAAQQQNANALLLERNQLLEERLALRAALGESERLLRKSYEGMLLMDLGTCVCPTCVRVRELRTASARKLGPPPPIVSPK